jgi:sec-independent protein translocase protein TatA
VIHQGQIDFFSVFGPKKLPDLGKGIGQGIRALREGTKDTPDPGKNTSAAPLDERSPSA